MALLPREGFVSQVALALGGGPVVGIVGPRQCGKTTLARQLAASLKHTWFDLEDPESQARLAAPELVIDQSEQVVVIDEVQHQPKLLELIRVLVDREPERKFVLLGSASPDLLRHTSESLAGRISYIELSGFLITEVEDRTKLWMQGGFPRSYLAASSGASLGWRKDFIQTFLQRDLGAFDLAAPPATMRRFWTMLAHYHGQIWNSSAVARSLGVSDKTARHYLDILEGTFMVRQLQPWWENLGKRLVKAPKVYVRDSGLLHALLGLENYHAVMGHPVAGASWEGFALEQVLAHVPGDPYFWATHQGAELDLLLLRRKERWGFEFKLSGAPKLSKSMRIALEDLKLAHLWVVHAGTAHYPLHEQVTAIPLADLPGLA